MNGTSSRQVIGSKGTQETLEQTGVQSAAVENGEKVSSTMPNADKAITPRDKFINYSLDPDNPNAKGKAEAYEKGLGYTKNNADGLIEQVHRYVTADNKPYGVSQSEYGTKFKFRIPVTGPNGKTKNVIAVYQIDNGQSIPRMITNYLEGKK
jgi:hypothetical protein